METITNMYTLEILTYDGNHECYDNIHSFEFRTNHVRNWIKLRFVDGSNLIIYDVCKIKHIRDRYKIKGPDLQKEYKTI